jgi:biopolymer transport protein ExbB
MNCLAAPPLFAAAPGGTGGFAFLTGGGLVGGVILLLSLVAAALAVALLVRLRRERLMPAATLGALAERLGRGRPEAALEHCLRPENDCYLCRILSAGLNRFLRSGFGAIELRGAIEEAGGEETARLYRATDALGVIGSVAPLLGLLGTVQGMIGAFDTVATSAADPGYYGRLAGNISLALITTLQGLVVAIPCVILFSFFRNRIDALAADAAKELDRLALLLEESPRPGFGEAAP